VIVTLIIYVVLIMTLALSLDLRRAFLICSPVPAALYLTGFFTLWGLETSVIHTHLGVVVLIILRRRKERTEETVFGLVLSSLPMVLYGAAYLMSRWF
jgi:hypothetical protein